MIGKFIDISRSEQIASEVKERFPKPGRFARTKGFSINSQLFVLFSHTRVGRDVKNR